MGPLRNHQTAPLCSKLLCAKRARGRGEVTLSFLPAPLEAGTYHAEGGGKGATQIEPQPRGNGGTPKKPPKSPAMLQVALRLTS